MGSSCSSLSSLFRLHLSGTLPPFPPPPRSARRSTPCSAPSAHLLTSVYHYLTHPLLPNPHPSLIWLPIPPAPVLLLFPPYPVHPSSLILLDPPSDFRPSPPVFLRLPPPPTISASYRPPPPPVISALTCRPFPPSSATCHFRLLRHASPAPSETSYFHSTRPRSKHGNARARLSTTRPGQFVIGRKRRRASVKITAEIQLATIRARFIFISTLYAVKTPPRRRNACRIIRSANPIRIQFGGTFAVTSTVTLLQPVLQYAAVSTCYQCRDVEFVSSVSRLPSI